jgi:hypothetical protein
VAVHPLLALQSAAGNRAVAGMLQRSVRGQARARAAADTEVAQDRQFVAQIVQEARASQDKRLANSAEFVMTDRNATLFVGTPRWNSDQIASEKPEAPEDEHPEFRDIETIYYAGTAAMDPPLFRQGAVVAPPPFRDQLNRRDDAHSAGTMGDADQQRSRIRIYGPRLPDRGGSIVEETLRHEIQHALDRTDDLLGPASLAQEQRGTTDYAMREGLREFFTEQRAFRLERPGGALETHDATYDFAEQHEYARDDADAELSARVGGLIPEDKAASVLAGVAGLPADPVGAAKRNARAYRASGGTVALVQRLLRSRSYEAFTCAWLLEDVLDVPNRPFQTQVLRSKPDFANPANSVRINAVWSELRRLRPDTRPGGLWELDEDPPTSGSTFVHALETLQPDEFRFLLDSPLFRRQVLERTSREVLDHLVTWAEGRDQLLAALRRYRKWRQLTHLRAP